jgi:hypothetical protein
MWFDDYSKAHAALLMYNSGANKIFDDEPWRKK